MQLLLTWFIATDTIFSYPQNSPALRCLIFSGLQHTSKIYPLLDFILEGEILAIVTDCRLIAVISNIRTFEKLWIGSANLQFSSRHKIVDWQKQGKI